MSSPKNPAPNLRTEFSARCAQARRQLIDAAADPVATQAELLKTFIARNVDSAFGREHGFKDLRTPEDFRRAVPIRDAADFAPWLDRVAAGENGVLTSEPMAMFFRTAGTTGPPKRLPATRTAMGTTRGPAMYALWGNFLEFHPELMEHENATLDIHWDRRPITETVGPRALPLQSMAQRHDLMHAQDFSPPWFDAAWFRPRTDDADYVERLYSKLRFFAAHDVRAIASINPMTMHLFAEILARQTDRLIEDLPAVAAGRLRPKAKERGGRLLPMDLWPNLSFLGCRKSANAALYLRRLPKLFGENVSIRPYSTAGAEGSQAIPVDDHDTAGVAALRSTFMEFLPAASPWAPDSSTLLVHELELGAEYQTVLTTPDGLYRYAIGDLFRVVDFVGPTPLLEYRGRTGRVSSMLGENLSEPEVVDAGRAVMNQLDLDLALFVASPRAGSPDIAAAGSKSRPRYAFTVETADGLDAPEAVARMLDEHLTAGNEDYAKARAFGALAPAAIEQLPPGTFHDHWLRSVTEGRGTIQLQIQPLQQDDALVRGLSAEISRG